MSKDRINITIEILVFLFVSVGIFALGFRYHNTNDTFFGLKLGEIVLKGGLPFKEPFSWSAQGRAIVPYEWLAQVLILFVYGAGGFAAISFYVAIVYDIFFILTFFVFRKVFDLGFFQALVFAVFLVFSIWEFFVPRPQIIAFVFLIALLGLIYLFILKGKNRLILLLPITYFWTNMHASFIFAPVLLGAYAFCAWAFYKVKKEKLKAKNSFKTLILFSFVCFLATLAPPLFTKPYLLLFNFVQNRDIVTKFIVEWGSVSNDTYTLIFYVFLVILAVAFCLFFSFKQKNKEKWIIALPLLLIATFSFQAIRQVVFGTIAMVFLVALFMPKVSKRRFSKAASGVFLVFVAVIGIYLISTKNQSKDPMAQRFAESAMKGDIRFLKSEKLKGHMYNEFALGSYLIYYLYPDYKVFFDGRADVYLCCEMRDFWPLIENKNTSFDSFKKAVYKFVDKYNFSYMVIPYPDYNPASYTSSTLMASVLLDDPKWKLVYFSDDMQILVKDDGKNMAILDSLKMEAATPYSIVTSRKNQQNSAVEDYRKMVRVQDSGVARGGLGFTLLSLGRWDEAKAELKRASYLNPYLGKSYLGLGKVAVHEGKTEEAVADLKLAIDKSPFLGEAYLLLAGIDKNNGDLKGARDVLEKGLSAEIDLLSRQKLVLMLNGLNSIDK